MNRRYVRRFMAAMVVVSLGVTAHASETPDDLAALLGRPADVASGAYQYRADRGPDQNPPESWILLIQYAGLPYDKPPDMNVPAVKQALCGLLWEEVRPIRRLELTWSGEAANIPPPDQLTLTYFDSSDQNAHTWWNPLMKTEAGPPEVSTDGRTCVFAIPRDTWGVVVGVRGDKEASAYSVPAIRALVPETWKRLDLEIEWGFDAATATSDYSGRIEPYDGIVGEVRPLEGDTGTTMTGPLAWNSVSKGGTRRGNAAGKVAVDGRSRSHKTSGGSQESPNSCEFGYQDASQRSRRGVRMSVLYIGRSAWRRVWPYDAQAEDVARTILTVWTESGSFSFLVADLEHGPILAPEFGFFVRATGTSPMPPAEAASGQPALTVPKVLLGPKMNDILGNQDLRGWGNSASPWFAGNGTDQPVALQGITFPARSVGLHPGSDCDVAVGWQSPVDSRVSVRAQVADAHPSGGDGVEWSIVHEGQTGSKVLVRGAVDRGGAQSIPPETEADRYKVADIAVRSGDTLALVVSRKGNHLCDSTMVELVISERSGPSRTWDLAKDVVDTIHAGNPRADSLGNRGVWSFYTIQGSAPAPHEPPFAMSSQAASARQFVKELAARQLATVRQRVRLHPEQTWQQAVQAMHPGKTLPPHPRPPSDPIMQIEVPCERLSAQWNLGAWHILRHSVQDPSGKWFFNDFPFGILASETYMILRALDLQGRHQETADGLDQWLQLPLQPKVVPGSGGHHGWALPDRPLGLFSDGRGCLTHAEGPPGAGGHMDGVHAMGPGAIMFTLIEHFRMTGDVAWLKASAPRMKANVEWILRQRQLLAENLPGGQRLWSKGLQPAHVVTPDSHSMHMQFYETEAYYWLAVKRMAELLTLIEPDEGARLAAEAEAYRQDLVAAVDRSIVLTPVVAVRDGTYRSFVAFSPYVRGFAAGAWGWRRCQGHVGAIYWDTVQSADSLISPAGLLSPVDARVQGHLDVLEDRLLLENTKVHARTPDYDPDRHWFSHASWQYQCGLERHANIHLAADDVP
ncbi:MAG: hypothetical protein ISR77_08405, partial [Pirellulaceae bacterium]|nr:hypothetical protein [Pirellulaceae bacterium]